MIDQGFLPALKGFEQKCAPQIVEIAIGLVRECFLEGEALGYLHVFTYSERDNTEAAEMPNVVPMNVRNKRSKMLRGLSVKKRRAFYESQIGTNRTVLFESENKEVSAPSV